MKSLRQADRLALTTLLTPSTLNTVLVKFWTKEPESKSQSEKKTPNCETKRAPTFFDWIDYELIACYTGHLSSSPSRNQQLFVVHFQELVVLIDEESKERREGKAAQCSIYLPLSPSPIWLRLYLFHQYVPPIVAMMAAATTMTVTLTAIVVFLWQKFSVSHHRPTT